MANSRTLSQRSSPCLNLAIDAYSVDANELLDSYEPWYLKKQVVETMKRMKQINETSENHQNKWYSTRYFRCGRSVRIRSYSGRYFPAFGLNTVVYGVSLRIQSECGKKRTRTTPNAETFYTFFRAEKRFKDRYLPRNNSNDIID